MLPVSTRSLEIKLGVGFAVALACIIALGAMQYHMARRLAKDDQQALQNRQRLEDLDICESRLNAADAAAQSFVITAQPAYLDTFRQSETDVRRQIGELRGLSAPDAALESALDRLAMQADADFVVLQNEIDARQSGASTAEKLFTLETAIRKTTGGFRTTVGDIQTEQNRLIASERDSSRQANQQTSALIILGSIVAFGLLAASGIGLYFDVAERRRAERNLQESERSLRELSHQLLRSQDEERRRIGRELHDSVGQSLVFLKLGLDRLLAELSAGDPRIAATVAGCLEAAEDSIKEVRTMSYLLHPPMLDEAGLQVTLPWYVEGFSKRSGIRTTCEISPQLGRLTPEVELAMFRILQESLTNVHKHSGSPTAEVRLEQRNGSLFLEVQDHGKGMPQTSRSSSSLETRRGYGVGLRGMNERVRQLGGRLEVISAPASTTVRATIPCPSIPANGNLYVPLAAKSAGGA